MSSEEPKPAEAAEENELAEPSPHELAVAGFRKRMEHGDFVEARLYLRDRIQRLEPDQATQLEHQRARLSLDPIAIAVMAVCGGLLAVVLAINLFH